MIKFVSDLWQVVFSPGTSVFSTNKTDRHDITESGVKYNNTIVDKVCQLLASSPLLHRITLDSLSHNKMAHQDALETEIVFTVVFSILKFTLNKPAY